MLRLLGFVFAVVICVSTAPWGLLVGALLCVGYLCARPVPTAGAREFAHRDQRSGALDAGSRLLSAIPLVNAVYCVNCDLITNSPHDDCAVCGSHSVISVSRMWQFTSTEAPMKLSTYKVSFVAEVRGIPANGLHESTKLICRLAELGGDVRALHIQVDPVFFSDAAVSDAKIEVLKPLAPTSAIAYEQMNRQAC